MDWNLKIEENKDVPLYRQIAEGLLRDIYGGKLQPGYQLPTVRELAEELGISRGTIRHAYEYLTRMGAIEMTQGRGTFVCAMEEDKASRKEKAMAAFDDLFETLEHLGFTPREIEIYFRLKLQGLEEAYAFVKVAVVDCNPEALRLMEMQLSSMEYVETSGFLLSQLGTAAEKLNEEYDLVLTTSTHFSQVETVIRDTGSMAMMAMRPTKETVINLARMDENQQVGIVCASRKFAEVIRMGCEGMGSWSRSMEVFLLGDMEGLDRFLSDLTVAVVPAGYESFASEKEKRCLREFEKEGGKLIAYDYAIDRGSFLYVKERIARCLNKKRSQTV